MYKTTIYLLFLFLVYSCSPINKQHGYLIEDVIYAANDIELLESKESHKNDVLSVMGSPSIKIEDVDDVWIYLVSVKEEKIFEKNEINFQTIFRFQFDHKGFLVKTETYDQSNYSEIAFSKEKTVITREAYGISDQIYDAITRGN